MPWVANQNISYGPKWNNIDHILVPGYSLYVKLTKTCSTLLLIGGLKNILTAIAK